jgi:hypothetical protein
MLLKDLDFLGEIVLICSINLKQYIYYIFLMQLLLVLLDN